MIETTDHINAFGFETFLSGDNILQIGLTVIELMKEFEMYNLN